MRRSYLELAAHLGDREAASSLGVQAAPDAETDFDAWAWQLSDWGQETIVRASLAAARFVLPIYENYQPTDEIEDDILGGSRVRTMLDAADSYLAGGPEAETELVQALTLARTLDEKAWHYEREGEILYDNRAFHALVAACAALEAAGWSAAAVKQWGEQFGIDAAEIAARVEAGPALHTVHALHHALFATNGTIAELLSELRRVLL